MTRSSYYANNLNRNLNENDGLPVISQDLESIRSYQWEITFFPPAEVEVPLGFSKPLTLAAKNVGDNLLRTKAGWQLYKYFQTVYDPLTGEFSSTFLDNPGQYKTTAEILELDGQMDPVSLVKLVGIYPKKFSKAEKAYATNEFDTVVVTFRYDFLLQLGDTRG